MKCTTLAALVLALGPSANAVAASVFTTLPEDPSAILLSPAEFGARGDGRAADSFGGNGGIVFLPAGRYRLSRTLYVWRGLRVIGFGATRPVLLLARDTPGYRTGIGLMVMFTH